MRQSRKVRVRRHFRQRCGHYRGPGRMGSRPGERVSRRGQEGTGHIQRIVIAREILRRDIVSFSWERIEAIRVFFERA